MNSKLRLLSALLSLLLVSACESAPSPDTRNEAEGDEGAGEIAVSRQKLVAAAITAKYDTTLHAGFPNNNDGASEQLGVTAVSVADVQRTLLRFEQSEIAAAVPAPNVLYSARIDLFTTGVSLGWLGDSMDILRMTQPWVEGNTVGNGASWLCANDTNTSFFGNLANDCANPNNWRMTPGGPFPQPYVTVATDRTSLFSGGLSLVSFDVTADVQKFLQATPNHGWMIAASPNLIGGQTVTFASRTNADVSKRPKLIIEYGPDQCPSDPNKGVPGVCGCGVADLDTNQDNVIDCYDATVTATQDTALRLAIPFGNDGTGALLPATSASVVDLERSLLRVDSFAIAAATSGRTIKKAELELTVAGIAVGWLGGRLGLNRMTQSWVEGNGLAGHGASWACADDTNTTLTGLASNDCTLANLWTMPLVGLAGGPFDPALSATTGLVWPGLTSVRFDVTEDVKKFAADPAGVVTPNHGWLMQGVASNFASGSWVQFGSRESGAPPRLLLDLDPICPVGTDGDRDGDLVPDCKDGCIDNVAKSSPGSCGCDVADVDTDGDKIPNCIDPCPLDPDPMLGGGCGCPSTPVAAGTQCVGVCAGSGNRSGQDVCDGHGHCGSPGCQGPIPGGNCRPTVTSTDFYWSCDPRDANAAKTACEAVRGQTLAQIDSAGENSLLRALISGDTWLSARDTVEGQWRWSHGSGAQFWQGNASGKPYFGRYSNWSASQPSDVAADADCAAMVAASGQWEARPCTTPLRVMCVRPKAAIPVHHRNADALPAGCELSGNCGEHDDPADCVDPSTVNLCNWNASPSSCGQQARSALNRCDACMKANSTVCNENADPATCRNACAAACSDADDFAPNAADRCPSIEDSYEGRIRCALQAAPPGSAAQTCQDDSGCSGGQRCGVAFYCTADGVTKGAACSVTTNNPNATPGQDPCPGSINDECLAFDVCGTLNANCGDRDFGVPAEPCREVDLCVAPGDEYTVDEPTQTDIEELVTPTPLVPQTAFGNKQTPTANLVETWPDPACPYPQTNCAPPNGDAHAWCTYDVNEQLADRHADQTKDAQAGPSKLTFKFDPRFTLDYKLETGPLGLPLPSVAAEASLVAHSRIDVFPGIPAHNLQILDVGLGAEMGVKLTKRVDEQLKRPGYDGAADLCGFRGNARAKILGLDIVPASRDDGVSFPAVAQQRDCVETLQTLIEQIDRVRKAYADARELVRQYQALKNDLANPRTFGGLLNGTLCEQVAKNPPRGFPTFGGNCALEAPEATINRFIYYYNVVVIEELRAKARQLARKLDLWVAVNDSPVGNFPVVNEKEEITIFNQTFMIGPVPVNLEVLLPIGYGFDVRVYPKLALGNLAKQLILGDGSLVGSDPFAQLTLDAAPYASAAISLFAGVGFDIGFASAKLGIEGAISLGLLAMPVYATAGVAAGVEPDPRNLSSSFAALHLDASSSPPLIPKQKVNFSLFYQYGADLDIREVLNGELSGRLKLKFFWFSVSYRSRFLKFNGLCSEPQPWVANPPDSAPRRKKWCDVQLFNSGLQDAWDWGTVQMPVLFTPMKYVVFPTTPLARTAKFNPEVNPGVGAGGVKELFYDSLCQCLPTYDPAPGAYNSPKDCYRNDDCCSAECKPRGDRMVCIKRPT